MKHLVLVGPMGVGKTTVGRAVAQRLGRVFVDTDDLVVAAAGREVAEVFAREGERAFRAHERVALGDACTAPEPAVIGCGGGAVLDPENRRVIARAGFVVWLDAPPAVLAERVGGGEGRPLLASGDHAATLGRIRELRADAYEAVADAHIDTDRLSVDEVVDAVVGVFGEEEG